ncbi:MAG: hypothetical protein RMM31_08260 [Anaerolineae bacterium]|nr:hypothetical protein [Thermoflexales bacterium]MDW8396221.1 hypothetical protein [Anaerolineae bacterium]
MLSLREAQRNERLHALEVGLIAPFFVIAVQFLPVLVARLDASPLLLGVFVSGSAAALTVASALGAVWLRRFPDFTRSTVLPALVWRFVLLVVAGLLLIQARVEILVVIVVVMHLAAGLTTVGFVAFMPYTTLPERLSWLTSMRWTVLALGIMVCTALIGLILEGFQFPLNYVLVCVGATLIGALSSYALARFRPVPAVLPTGKASGAASGGFAALLRHAPARDYLWITLLAHTLFQAQVPLLTLRFVRDLGVSDADFSGYVAIFWGATGLFGLLVPRLTQWIGDLRSFALSCVGLGAQGIILGLAQTLPTTWFAGVIGGAASVLFQVTTFSLLVACAPKGHYEAFVSAHTTAVNAAALLGPLAASALNEAGLSVVSGLTLVGLARILLGGLTIWQLRLQ